MNKPASYAAQSSQHRYGERFQRDATTIHFRRAEELYDEWPTPTCIVVDGPYGLSGFPGDMPTVGNLAEWYLPHVRAWSDRATPQTTLWFWNSEIGWATIHSLLVEHGWEYRNCHVWDKGIGHVAGNTNTQTLRKFPVTTEICVQYVKSPRFSSGNESLTMQEWLRFEWQRSGLPFHLANTACGVLNAATRKYLAADHLWYCPPPDAFRRLAEYANTYGRRTNQPYFSIDGIRPMNTDEWVRMRAKFTCPMGITNVWRHPQVSGHERINGERERMRWKYKSLHGSQKPLKLISAIIQATTEENDVVWEPFGGLCPAAVASWQLNRASCSAEIIREFYSAAIERLSNAHTATKSF